MCSTKNASYALTVNTCKYFLPKRPLHKLPTYQSVKFSAPTLRLSNTNMARKPFDPDKEISDYCDHIMHSHTQVLRRNKKEKTWYWDFPATAAICHDGDRLVKRGSFSHYPDKKGWHPVLKSKLEEIAEIGDRLVGNCAEQHAGNIYMNQLNENNLAHLHFSIARRPRTKEEVPYCHNCKRTFPNL